MDRRDFVKNSTTASIALVTAGPQFAMNTLFEGSKPDLKISLAQWSLHKTLFSGGMTNMDFAEKARSFDIGAIEYVSAFFDNSGQDSKYLNQLNQRAHNQGVKQLLIMIDGEGALAEKDSAKRKTSVENHYKWVDTASELRCHSIRVNAYGEGTREEMHAQAVEGLSMLAEYAAPHKINIIVENHGGLSSDGKWLAGVLKEVNMPNCGSLPDFGNFCIRRQEDECVDEYDRYQGVSELLPYAKAVSAKSYDFDENGMETKIDFKRMIDLVTESGYSGYIGVEYEGSRLSEDDGIRATKALLEKYI